MSFAKIRPRRGTATQWTTANPILAEGELAIEVPTEGVGTGLVKIKIGDGVTSWNDLPYAVEGSIDLDTFVAQTLEGAETDKVPSVKAVSDIDSHTYYDRDQDVLYLKLEDDTLFPFTSGGVKEFNLNDLTKLSPEDWEFEYANNASGAEVTSNPFKFSMTTVSDTGKSNVTATTTKAFNLGSFNRFVMSGKIKGYLNQGSVANDYYHKIAFVNTTTGNEDYVWSDINSYTSATDISESAVISLDSTASYKIRLRVFGYKGHTPSYFEFPDFRLYKEV